MSLSLSLSPVKTLLDGCVWFCRPCPTRGRAATKPRSVEKSALLKKKNRFVEDSLYSAPKRVAIPSGPGFGMVFTAVPSCETSRIAPHLFRVLLLRRLRLPLPPVARTCRCGGPTDFLCHPRSVQQIGALGQTRLEGVLARRPTFSHDFDCLARRVHDARRFEIIAEGLPVLGGAQLAVGTTLVGALRCDGSSRPLAARGDRVALFKARERKENTCTSRQTGCAPRVSSLLRERGQNLRCCVDARSRLGGGASGRLVSPGPACERGQ